VPVNCATASPRPSRPSCSAAPVARRAGRDGLFVYAQGGTLFLDEVANCRCRCRPRCCGCWTTRRIRPVGGEQEIPVDVRIVAASNRSWPTRPTGRFRADLYYRLQVVEINLPPLRSHKEDIADLVAHFIATLAPQLGVRADRGHPDELAYLQQYDWPGNVRELAQPDRALADPRCAERVGAVPGLRAKALPTPTRRSPRCRPTCTRWRSCTSWRCSTRWAATRHGPPSLLGISRRTLERRVAEWAAR
jgi:transcriptional regulator of acetoin/glycerol metabolism